MLEKASERKSCDQDRRFFSYFSRSRKKINMAGREKGREEGMHACPITHDHEKRQEENECGDAGLFYKHETCDEENECGDACVVFQS